MTKHRSRPPRRIRWSGDRLTALRFDYEEGEKALDKLAAEYHTDRPNICRLARRHGWCRRMSSWGIAAITESRWPQDSV